jgi:hypothetical protein
MELYDLFMEIIEPELVSSNLATLEERYRDATEEEKQQRLRHFEDCFALFDAAVDDMARDMVRHYSQSQLSSTKKKLRSPKRNA